MAMKIPWTSRIALNAATAAVLKAATNAASTIYVTKITLSIVTHAAKFVHFQDTNGTPVVIAAHIDAAAGAGIVPEVEWDFGSNSGHNNGFGGPKGGIPLTVGMNFVVIGEAAGVVGYAYAEGYQLVVG